MPILPPTHPTQEDSLARYGKLWEEFQRILKEETAKIPPEELIQDEMLHELHMYQIWSMQRIAGLQVLVEHQGKQIRFLADELNRLGNLYLQR